MSAEKKHARIVVVNGPNLNLLGQREPGIYGSTTLEQCIEGLRARYPEVDIDAFQSNIEGELVTCLQRASAEGCDGIVLNAAAYTHTSVALHDAIRAIDTPVVEVHISNVAARESFRHVSLIAPACAGSISGFGLDGYRLAVEALLAMRKDVG